MNNLLNLDEIEVESEKSFTFKGKNYVMTPLSVGDYVKQTKKLEALEGQPQSDTIEFMLSMIRSAFPGLTEAIASKLTMAQIDALMVHIQGDITEEMEEGNDS